MAMERGVYAASEAYEALLRHPFDEWRASNQHVYCLLRDYIAHQTGRSSEYVQREFEEGITRWRVKAYPVEIMEYDR